MAKSVGWVWTVVFFLSICASHITSVCAEEAEGKISRLKPLNIETVLAAEGKPAAVIVCPSGDRYAEAVRLVQQAVKRHAGIELPVLRNEANTHSVLGQSNVIALGNMSTNPFIEQLYREWYVLLDLKYPGKGGYVVRSLHNPYATGKNVIFLGGSDDGGVKEAARVFADLLKPQQPLKVGWLMEIKLGEGVNPPAIGDTVYSWRDSWRRDAKGRETGYAPSTYFGWNPISIQGVLYYMTGRKEYLDEFKRLAMPDPNNIPLPNRTDSTFYDPLRPLVENYHYRAHLVDCVWDLIEEGPLFSDEERLRITNDLLAHQDYYDPKDTFCQPNASRHGMWHMLCIYTGSRYFGKYYPSPRWGKRIENVRKAFQGWIGNPTWGELDTLSWVSTSTEPVFEFFMLDGFKDFVGSGTARGMMQALEVLWTGKAIEESTTCLTINLLYKAAYMLKDGRYIYIARRLGFDFDAFRIGQSFWPPDDLKPVPPTDLVGKVSVHRLPKGRWEWTMKAFPAEEAFHFLSYRSGLEETDDYFMIDGFFGRGRNPYHVDPVYILRLNDKLLLSGYASQISIRRQGMVEPTVANAAALKKSVAVGDMAYIKTNVPNMPFASWDRHLLYFRDNYVIVFDEVDAREGGEFEVVWRWNLLGSRKKEVAAERAMESSTGAVICCDRPVPYLLEGRFVKQCWEGRLQEGESIGLTSLLYASNGAESVRRRIAPVGTRACIVTQPEVAFVSFAPFASSYIDTDAEFLYLSSDRLFMIDGTKVRVGGSAIVECGGPVSLLWNLADGTEETALRPGQRGPRLSAVGEAADAIKKALVLAKEKVVVQEVQQPVAKPIEPNWQPTSQTALKGSVTHIAHHFEPGNEPIWIASNETRRVKDETGKERPEYIGRLFRVDGNLKTIQDAEYAGRILSLHAANSPKQIAVFAALVGFDDDMVRAIGAEGKEVWNFRGKIHPEFKVGDRYQAPWFSDPSLHHGIFDILAGDLWNKGEEEIAVSRPCTVEFHRLDGSLVERVAVKWGDCTSLALLARPGEKGERWVLVGKFHTGTPGVTLINSEYHKITDGAYRANAQGYTHMSAWMQRGLSHLVTCDIDNDGIEEVIVVLSGHWNELKVFKGGDWTTCRWMATFGAAPSRSKFMRGLVVADLRGDDTKEVVVGMENGWVCAFDCNGKPLWQTRVPSAARAMCGARDRTLAVGCADGSVYRLDGDGTILQRALLDGSVAVLHGLVDNVLVGCDNGVIAIFPGTEP